MKNLFDYATKELSQDAFLSWIIANYDDSELGKYAYDFINTFTDFNLIPGEIRLVKICQQEHNIDIIAKIWTSPEKINEEIPDFILAIEDKTTSSAHNNQLLNYGKILNEYNFAKKICMLFYKANYLSNKDNEELEKAFKKGQYWKQATINEIYDFFNDKNDTKSQVFNNYADHVCHIYNALNCKTKDKIENWTSYHWRGFADNYLKEFNNEKSDLEEYVWVYDYQGKYVSINYQRCLPNSKDAAVIEIFVRNSNHLSAIFHHSFFDGSDKRKWAIKDCEVESERKRANDVRNKLLLYMKNTCSYAKYKSKIKVVNNNKAFKCFGKIVEDKKVMTLEEASNTILNWIRLFNDIIGGFKTEQEEMK